MKKELKNYSKDTTEEKNDLIYVDTRGIIPCPDCGYDFKAPREHCKNKGIKVSDMPLEELEQFLQFNNLSIE